MSTLIFTALLAVGLGFLARTLYRRFAVLLKVDAGAALRSHSGAHQRRRSVRARTEEVRRRRAAAARRQSRRAGCTSSSSGASRSWPSRSSTCSPAASSPTSICRAAPSHLLGGPYLLLKDLIQVVVLGAIGMALYRWIVSHPARLFGFAPAENRLRGQSHGEALLILVLIGGIMISGFLYDGGHLYQRAVHAGGRARSAPGSRSARSIGLIALQHRRRRPGGIRQQRRLVAAQLHHPLLPQPAAALQALPHHHLDAERLLQEARAGRAAQQAGPRERHDVRHVVHQSVHLEAGARHVLVHRVRALLVALPGDDTAARAGAAPAAAQPARLSLRARRATCSARATATAAATAQPATVGENIVGERLIHDDVLWACTTCRACEEACPVLIEYVDKIVDMRRHLVQEESRFPAELTRTFKAMETQGNPWGVDASTRADWAAGPRHPDDGREARRRVPLLRRLRRLVRRPRQAHHAGGGEDPQGRQGRLRHPRRRGAVQRRDGAPHRQRVPLPDHGADGRRGARRLQGAQDRHQLPALLQHVQERLPAVRRQLRGRPRHRARRAADRRGQARASSSARSAPSPSTTPATWAATTTSSRRRATSSA